MTGHIAREAIVIIFLLLIFVGWAIWCHALLLDRRHMKWQWSWMLWWFIHPCHLVAEPGRVLLVLLTLLTLQLSCFSLLSQATQLSHFLLFSILSAWHRSRPLHGLIHLGIYGGWSSTDERRLMLVHVSLPTSRLCLVRLINRWRFDWVVNSFWLLHLVQRLLRLLSDLNSPLHLFLRLVNAFLQNCLLLLKRSLSIISISFAHFSIKGLLICLLLLVC